MMQVITVYLSSLFTLLGWAWGLNTKHDYLYTSELTATLYYRQ